MEHYAREDNDITVKAAVASWGDSTPKACPFDRQPTLLHHDSDDNDESKQKMPTSTTPCDDSKQHDDNNNSHGWDALILSDLLYTPMDIHQLLLRTTIANMSSHTQCFVAYQHRKQVTIVSFARITIQYHSSNKSPQCTILMVLW
jgi:hypothetical protein